jgi:hypothetical protein
MHPRPELQDARFPMGAPISAADSIQGGKASNLTPPECRAKYLLEDDVEA